MKALIAILILASPCIVKATDYRQPNINVGAQALSSAGAIASTGNSVSNVNVQAPDFGDMRIVPPAIAPSINTGVICPMVMQGSKAGSVFFFSGSGTHAPDIVPICVAWHLGQKDVVEKMTCAASKEYAKANGACK